MFKKYVQFVKRSQSFKDNDLATKKVALVKVLRYLKSLKITLYKRANNVYF